jgi:multidrug efflux system outer membrane protein
MLRYDEGYASYIEVTDAERGLFNAELIHTGIQGSVLNAYINLYKSMGGGWVEDAEKRVPTPPEAPPAMGECVRKAPSAG